MHLPLMILFSSPSGPVNCDALSLEPSSPLSVATPEGLIEGATAIYSCSSGYVLEGDPERVCLGGVWNGSKPTCTGMVTMSTSLVH